MDPNEEYLNIFKPLYVLSSIFCMRKYTISNGNVFPVRPREICLTLTANCILIYLFYGTFLHTAFTQFSLKLYYFVIYGQHLFTFIVISFYNMKLSKVYVALMRKLQEIYCFEKSQLSPKALRRKLRITCGILIYLYIGVIIPKLILDPYWNWSRAVFLGLTIIIDFELLFIIFVVKVLAMKFKMWTDVINKLASEKISNSYSKDGTENNGNEEFGLYVIHLDDSNEQGQHPNVEQCPEINIRVDNASEIKKIFLVFKQLVDGTNLMKTAFQFTIFFHAFTLFTQSLVYIAVLILWMRLAEHDLKLGNSVLISHSTGIIMWITKALVLEAVLGSTMESMYSGARAAQAAASVLMTRGDLTTTRCAKNALRSSICHLHRFTAVGLLRVDAALPLRLARLVSAYTVVLLQFAFL